MWWQRFVNRTDAYSVQTVVDGKLQYYSQYFPLTANLFDAHLMGAITLGLPAVNGEGLSRWCCFDSDKADGALDRIHKVLFEHGWHALREGARPGRDGHLWMFFQEPLSASSLRLFGQRIIETAGLSARSVEFFPKQDCAEFDHEKRRVRVCSVVRLPLGIHRKPDADFVRGWFSGVEQEVNLQTYWLEHQPLNPVSPIISSPVLQKQSTKIGERRLFLPPAELLEVIAALNFIPADDYKIWFRVGMALKSAGVDYAVWERWSSKSLKHYENECSKKWKSFPEKSKLGLGTVFFLAKQYGYSR